MKACYKCKHWHWIHTFLGECQKPENIKDGVKMRTIHIDQCDYFTEGKNDYTPEYK